MRASRNTVAPNALSRLREHPQNPRHQIRQVFANSYDTLTFRQKRGFEIGCRFQGCIDEVDTDNWGIGGESVTLRRARGS